MMRSKNEAALAVELSIFKCQMHGVLIQSSNTTPWITVVVVVVVVIFVCIRGLRPTNI